ncbi:TonB-dependent receptor [Duganella qianjiadongensis]|uniref:TonB-dependent receptor n=1 Tax=Duganella qianjiadongensis TaxID=2692176 RepID=A0ABW9VIT5_9BURK|nr:TonB-dependent receptor [Duganella qianjiadongensis]MYM39529.1 TonB-dependent receptor [Duganella qianjiadongensis]
MNTLRTPLALALLAAFSLYNQLASAQDAPLRQIGTVIIEGSRPTSLPTQIPTTFEGISHADIERCINATDAEDALKYMPSLLVRKRYIGDYNHAVLSTRASGTGNSARSMVYSDGILLSNYLGNGATFAPRWGMVSPELIERVDVLYGPFSAAYGGNSVGAVVDYVTRMPTQLEVHAKLTATHQPFRMYHSDGAYQGKLGSITVGDRSGNWAWLVDYSHTDSDGQPLTFPNKAISSTAAAQGATVVTGAIPGYDRANKPWLLLGTATQYHTLQDQFKAKLAYDFSPTLRASYTFGLWHNDSKGRPDSYLRDSSGQPVYSGNVSIAGKAYSISNTDFNMSNESLQHIMHGLSLKSHGKGEFTWELAASLYDYDKDQLRAPTALAYPAALNGGAGRMVSQDGTGWNTLAAKGTWRAGHFHVVDFGYQREAYKLATIENATSDWINGAAGARNSAFAGKTETNSLYAQDSWKFATDWKTVLGLRYEHWNAHDGATSSASKTAYHAERSENYLSPKFALAYQATQDWVIKASLGRAVRMPTVSELYQGGVNASGQLINNDPALKAEKSYTGELTADRKLEDGWLRLTAFGERTRDSLYSQVNVLAGSTVSTIQNVDRIHTKGLELSYTQDNVWRQGLNLNGSVTWTDSRIVSNDKFPASVGKWQPRIPEWRATAVVSYDFTDKLSVSYAARYSGRQFSTLDNSDPNGYAYMGASKYFTTDLRARYRIDQRWSAAVGVDNLNNYQYWNFHPYPQRTFIAELRYDL